MIFLQQSQFFLLLGQSIFGVFRDIIFLAQTTVCILFLFPIINLYHAYIVFPKWDLLGTIRFPFWLPAVCFVPSLLILSWLLPYFSGTSFHCCCITLVFTCRFLQTHELWSQGCSLKYMMQQTCKTEQI